MARIGLVVILLVLWVLGYNFFDYGLAAASWEKARPVVVPIGEALESTGRFLARIATWLFRGSVDAVVWSAEVIASSFIGDGTLWLYHALIDVGRWTYEFADEPLMLAGRAVVAAAVGIGFILLVPMLVVAALAVVTGVLLNLFK